ncbi:MAG: ferritin-like domain-containing protein [Azospirillum sp.]|nr:ferritin-like domain-containing protein [Azospirillum sp.]
MAYRHWTLDDIPWGRLEPAKVDPELLKVIKAAGLVEYNAGDYATYLCNVFPDDPQFQQLARSWAVEEIQHGEALGRWATLIDPSYDFATAFARFKDGYRVPHLTATASVRGSRSGEMVARCMVETGTSSFYSAIADATDEPVLKTVAQHIAADELRHYKMFYIHLKRCLQRESLGRIRRVQIALGRIAESEDEELAYAYYAANGSNEPFDRGACFRAYARRAFGYYQRRHLDRVVGMVFKACGLKPQTLFFSAATKLAWWFMDNKVRQLSRMAA